MNYFTSFRSRQGDDLSYKAVIAAWHESNVSLPCSESVPDFMKTVKINVLATVRLLTLAQPAWDCFLKPEKAVKAGVP
jgi:hypothetical protein